MSTRKNAQSGFTLVELMIVVIIVGILGAFAFPTYGSMVRRARYAEAKQQMGTIAKDVDIYRLERGTYPPDVGPNVRPQGVENWPAPADIPYQTSLDYDHWGVGGNQCYVQIGYAGENPKRAYTNYAANNPARGFKEFDDDLVLGVALYSCSLSKGAIN